MSDRSRNIAAALICLVVAIGGGWAVWQMPPADQDDPEAAAEFRAAVPTQIKAIQSMIADTQAGKNLSDMRVGMFSMNLLSELAERDNALGAYFHKDGRTMQDYLTDVFQYHAAEEVAHVAAMPEIGKPAIKTSARLALEALRHIPVDKDPPESQAQDRKDLADTLSQLSASLAEAAKE